MYYYRLQINWVFLKKTGTSHMGRLKNHFSLISTLYELFSVRACARAVCVCVSCSWLFTVWINCEMNYYIWPKFPGGKSVCVRHGTFRPPIERSRTYVTKPHQAMSPQRPATCYIILVCLFKYMPLIINKAPLTGTRLCLHSQILKTIT
jgi:hypothetical protein